jgi:hypothetical protein
MWSIAKNDRLNGDLTIRRGGPARPIVTCEEANCLRKRQNT